MAIKADRSDFHLRLKDMFNKQIRLQVRETNISKNSSRFHGDSIAALEKVKQQQHEHEKLQEMLEQNRQDQEMRLALEEQLIRKLEAIEESEAPMLEQLKRHKMLVKQRDKELMECIHTLKQATGTYINHDALPARVKGVTALNSDDGDHWIPFDLSASDKDGLDSLCQRLHRKNIDVTQWRHLVSLAAEMSMKSKVTTSPPPKDDARLHSSIIEIDLTSPTQHS